MAWETPDAEAELLKLIPYERVELPEDIARAALWLASDESDYITGITLFVDGGMTLSQGSRRAVNHLLIFGSMRQELFRT